MHDYGQLLLRHRQTDTQTDRQTETETDGQTPEAIPCHWAKFDAAIWINVSIQQDEPMPVYDIRATKQTYRQTYRQADGQDGETDRHTGLKSSRREKYAFVRQKDEYVSDMCFG